MTSCRTFPSATPISSVVEPTPDISISIETAPLQLPKPKPEKKPDILELTFMGDIMAHSVNFSMKDYDMIYDDIRTILLSDDLSFGNLETPVVENIKMSSYPRFNVHIPYVISAINGGFDVFSLANNHANDQGIAGIEGTLASMESLPATVYYSGLKKKITDPLQPVIINKNDWKILFLSITEILNSYDTSGKLVYYVAPTENARLLFLEQIAQMKATTHCDLFILSIHVNESEYVRTVNDKKRLWFSRLGSAGADIIWAHHPHVMQPWEIVSIGNEQKPRQVLYMFSMGNFISGQRYTADIKNPESFREYTGDSIALRVTVSRNGEAGYDSISTNPLLLTNHLDQNHGMIVKIFNDSFISSFNHTWQTYYKQRRELMSQYLPLLPSTP